jgi:hypothetical protein
MLTLPPRLDSDSALPATMDTPAPSESCELPAINRILPADATPLFPPRRITSPADIIDDPDST